MQLKRKILVTIEKKKRTIRRNLLKMRGFRIIGVGEKNSRGLVMLSNGSHEKTVSKRYLGLRQNEREI